MGQPLANPTACEPWVMQLALIQARMIPAPVRYDRKRGLNHGDPRTMRRAILETMLARVEHATT